MIYRVYVFYVTLSGEYLFQVITTFTTMFPIVDSSGASEYWKDLTEVSFAKKELLYVSFN